MSLLTLKDAQERLLTLDEFSLRIREEGVVDYLNKKGLWSDDQESDSRFTFFRLKDRLDRSDKLITVR